MILIKFVINRKDVIKFYKGGLICLYYVAYYLQFL